jgi:hypothetical protein
MVREREKAVKLAPKWRYGCRGLSDRNKTAENTRGLLDRRGSGYLCQFSIVKPSNNEHHGKDKAQPLG